MITKAMKKLTTILLTGMQALPFLALAQTTGGSGINAVQPLPTGIHEFSGFLGILNTFINWVFTILLILAVIFILMAAFKYLTAQGDAEKISGAHRMLIYAVVAIAVALLAQGLRFIVGELVVPGQVQS
jgi:uncharacterized membrane protein